MKILIGCLLSLGVGYGAYFVLNALPIGTGFAARYLCTAIFEQGEDARTIFNREVAPEHPLFAMATYEIDATQRSVEARSILGLGAMRAVHRPGFGCTLLVDTTAEALRTQAETYRRPKPASANPVTGLRKAVDTRWVDFLNRYLDEPTQTSLRTTKAILVSHRGKLLAEGYYSFSGAFFGGFGYRRLFDNFGPGSTSTSARTFDRMSEYFYAPLGYNIRNTDGSNLKLQFNFFVKGQQTSYTSQVPGNLTDLVNDQNEGFGFDVSYANPEGSWEVYYRYWSVENSEISPRVTIAGVRYG